ncbi:unnamed protein product, partial [Iphiclides podalirius]
MGIKREGSRARIVGSARSGALSASRSLSALGCDAQRRSSRGPPAVATLRAVPSGRQTLRCLISCHVDSVDVWCTAGSPRRRAPRVGPAPLRIGPRPISSRHPTWSRYAAI